MHFRMVGRPAPRVDTDALAAKLLEILGDVDAIELAMNGKPDSMFRLVCDSSGAEFVNHSVVDRYYDLLAPLLNATRTPRPAWHASSRPSTRWRPKTRASTARP